MAATDTGSFASNSRLTPDVFNGVQDEWVDWSVTFEAFVTRRHGARGLALLNAVQIARPEEYALTMLGAEAATIAYAVYSDLAMLCKGAALREVRAVEPGNGLAAWAGLLTRYAGAGVMRTKGLLSAILVFKFQGPAESWQPRLVRPSHEGGDLPLHRFVVDDQSHWD